MGKVIEINNLRYAYPDGTLALDGIDLDIFQGESVGIIGPNGAGKSTLLLHLNGILNAKGSDIRILGMVPEGRNLFSIRSKVGLVFQNPDNQLFMPTVFDDISFGPLNMGLPQSEIAIRAGKALEEVDMAGSAKRLSCHLSVGEKKRISIATVLSMDIEIMVLDEPSSNLDPGHRRDIIDLLKEFEFTKVIATHDLSLVAEVCSKVVLLDKGRVAAAGNAADILQDTGLLRSHNLADFDRNYLCCSR